MTQAAIESELMRLKDAALAATRARDLAFYRGYLAEDAIAVLPVGVMGKEAILRAVERGAIQGADIAGTRVLVLGPDAGLVTYRATFEGEGRRLAAFVTTLYARREGRWLGVLYQQTPLHGEAS